MWAAGCVAAQLLGLGNRTMFDSGDLGSELALIKSIFETLGTPDLDVWPVGDLLFVHLPSSNSRVGNGICTDQPLKLRDL
jgi:hypothetical protein